MATASAKRLDLHRPPDPADDPYGGAGGPLRRLAAFLIDYAVLVGLCSAASWMIGRAAEAAEVGAAESRTLASIVLLGLILLYFAAFEGSGLRATPGKLALGLEVADRDGAAIGFGRAIGRTLGKFVSLVALGVGLVMIAFMPRHRALHDLIAGTVVSRSR